MKIFGYLENVLLDSRFLFERLTTPIKEIEELPGNDPPVIAVHGIFGGWPSFGLKKYLLDTERHSYLLDWGNQTNHFESYVDRLTDFIIKHEIKNPILIGTSVGGLIAIECALKLGWDKIEKVVTLAAPYDGVNVPKIADIFPDVKEVRPGKRLIEEINNLIIPDGKIISIRGKEDESLFKNGKPRNKILDMILPYTGHARSQTMTPELVQDLNNVFNSI